MKNGSLLLLALTFFLPTFSQPPGNALSFDGTNDYVICALPAVFSNIGANDFTFEAWVYPQGAAFTRIVYAQNNVSNFANFSTGNSNEIYFYVVDNGTNYSVATSTTMPQNQWTHVAARWTAATNSVDVFFNGVLQPGGNGGTSTTGNDNLMTIGARTNAAQFFNGRMDEVRIWSTARNECDIAANMNRNFTGPQPGLVAAYDFDQGVPGGSNGGVTTLPDSSGSGNNGTLTNFALSGGTSNWIASTAAVNQTGNVVSGGFTMSDSAMVCPGDTFTFHDSTTQVISGQTMHSSMFTASNGCDSIITTTVDVFATYVVNDSGAVCSGGNYTFPDSSVQTNITSPVTYTSQLQTADGCDSMVVTYVDVLAAPVVNDSGSVCPGGSYTFPDSSVQTNITAPLVYTSLLQTSEGCDSIVSTSVSLIPVDTSVTEAGSTLTANSAGATAYQWLNCGNGYAAIPGATNTSFTPAVNGSYAVQVTENGCTDTSGCHYVIAIGLEAGQGMQVNVYPNPAGDHVYVEVGEMIDATVRVFDMQGRMLRSVEPAKGRAVLDFADLPRGMYLVRVETPAGSRTVRIGKR